jgi:hypothetical protein
MMKYHYECTDTFGGEANYSWVKRGHVAFRKPVSNATLIRAVKKAIGWEGWCRVHVSQFGDSMELRPTQTSGVNQVCFVEMYARESVEGE